MKSRRVDPEFATYTSNFVTVLDPESQRCHPSSIVVFAELARIAYANDRHGDQRLDTILATYS